MYTIEPEFCPDCEALVAYIFRSGPEHFVYGDPYECSGHIARSGEIKATSGKIRPCLQLLRTALADLGIKGWWKRIKDGVVYKVYL